MDATRHPLTKEQVAVPDPARTSLEKAEALEQAGNWYLAGETYRQIVAQHGAADTQSQARLLARAAACFDIASQHRPAARAYFDAASLLHNAGTRLQVAGELFNRAALHFLKSGETFNAGDAWRRAGLAFGDVPDAVISSSDNIPPVPASAGRFTVAGNCYTAAGDAFLQSGDNAMWACMAYWEAGRAHSTQGHGYHAFVAYRKALAAAIRFYGTHERDELRRSLPLTTQERTANLDPLKVMEDEAFNANATHQGMNANVFDHRWARTTTDRQIAAAFHEFQLVFAESGNAREAGVYRAAEKERHRRIMIAERRYLAAMLYWLWAEASNYGESLGRWSIVCIAVLGIFSFLYAAFELIKPVGHWFDYVYFSVVTFTSLGAGDIYPVGAAGKLVVCAEIISGLVMAGLLLTFVGNRFHRT